MRNAALEHLHKLIKHHPNVHAEADYHIDIGPEAGTDGGQLVAADTLEYTVSRTARFL